MNKIIFYTSHCPRCYVLETKLKQKGIEYTKCDDIDLMISRGMKMAPGLEVDGELMGFAEAVEWIKEQ